MGNLNSFNKKYVDNIIQQLDNGIDEVVLHSENIIPPLEYIIKLILRTLFNLQQYILKVGFDNIQQEIYFFKHQKPLIVSKLIYYNSIYKIEIERPYGGDKVIKKYLNSELYKVKKYFDHNIDFYKYYKTQSTYLDYKYFVRGNYDIRLILNSSYVGTDHTFSTSHDYEIAKIIANNLIYKYIEYQICDVDQEHKLSTLPKLNWTSSKTSLAELIYALHSQGVFDNGNADIKQIAQSLEIFFNIELGDFYHTYSELKNRKINRTKFLDNLRDTLIRKMDEEEER